MAPRRRLGSTSPSPDITGKGSGEQPDLTDTGDDALVPPKKRRALKPKVRSERVLMGPVMDKIRKDLAKADITDISGSLVVRGIPLWDKLAFAYLLGVDVLPLRRSVALIGEQKSGKSQLGWILLNMLIEYGGTAIFADVEKKNSPDQIISILGGPEEYARKLEAFFRTPKTAIEEIGEDVETFFNKVREADPGMQMPRMCFIDSMGAILRAAEEAAKTGDKGGYDGARTADAVSSVLKKLENKYINIGPFLMVIVNHEKTKIQEGNKGGGAPPGKTLGAGGAHKDFAASIIISMRAMDKPSTQTVSRSVYAMKTRKCSLSDTGRKIEVPVTSWRDEEGVKKVEWHWGDALCNHLLGPKFPTAVCKSLLGLSAASAAGRYNCEVLKLKNVTGAEVESAIWANQEILEELYQQLDIMEGEVFDITQPWPEDER